jgi:signal transduction histidine kinase
VRTPRVSTPIILTVAVVVITISLTIGWQILVARESGALLEGYRTIHWTLVIVGSLFFALIITAAILQSVLLVREIRTNQRQQNFIYAVTHELHTPLASLQLYLDTLREKPLDEKQRTEFLDIMSDDLGRLQGTIDKILNAARTEVRRAPRDPVDIGGLLRECVEEARERHELDDKAIRLEVPLGASVRGDKEQLRLAFRNLIENAVRYGGDEPRVELAVRPRSARRIEIEVADEGVGMPASALRRVFQRFQRLSHEGVFGSRGLGLGLYIVRNVVRAHGGSIRAMSEGLGTGSRFVMTLPGQLDGNAHPPR